MEHWTFNNSLPLREWFHDHCDVLLEKYVIKDGYLRGRRSHKWQIFQRKYSLRKRGENYLVTMTDHSLLNRLSFIEGIYIDIFHLHTCVFIVIPQFSFLTLVHLWLLPSSCLKLPPFLKISRYFFRRIALFYPLSNPLFSPWWGARWEAQVSLKRTSSLSWAREESVAMGTVSMAWKGAVANKTILPV